MQTSATETYTFLNPQRFPRSTLVHAEKVLEGRKHLFASVSGQITLTGDFADQHKCILTCQVLNHKGLQEHLSITFDPNSGEVSSCSCGARATDSHAFDVVS